MIALHTGNPVESSIFQDNTAEIARPVIERGGCLEDRYWPAASTRET